MPQDDQKEIFTGLTKEEKDFILNLFGRVQVGINEPNAVETCTIVRSIMSKFQNEKE